MAGRSASRVLVMLVLNVLLWKASPGGSGIDPAGFRDPSISGEAVISEYVVATTAIESDPYYEVAQTLADHRGGEVVTFDITDLTALMENLNESGARHVAVVVRPGEMDINFHRALIMNSTTLDEDPFTDFSWGYITGSTPEDAMGFVRNIIRAESEHIEDLPLDISGYSVSGFNARYPYTGAFSKYVANDFIDLYLEENDTGAGRDYFLSQAGDLEGRKLLDISGNGDPHMTWLFEGGNFDPVPPVWDYDPARIEDPAFSRMGITPENLTGLDLYPAVMFSGTCHSGVPKHALIEGDIAATFGDTGGTVRFYNMSDDFSFFNRIIQNNVTGYFAPIGANHGYMSIYDQWNALRFHEPLGDIQKRSLDQVVMGFMGNRPNLRLYSEGEDSGTDILPTGDFDPEDWPSAASMLGGKANRVYYGDPLYDPFKNDHDPRLNLTDVSYDYVNDTTMEMELSYHRPSPLEAWFPNWDMFHYGEDWFYEAVDLPVNYSDPISVSVVREDDSLQRFEVIEEIEGRSRLHVEADLPSAGYYNETWYNITYSITREKPFLPIYGLSVIPERTEGHALPGGNASYNISVRNIGTVISNVVTFHSGIPDGWNLSIDPSSTSLDPNEVKVARVNVSIPSDALFNTSTTITLSFLNHGSSYPVNLTTRVDRIFGVKIIGGNRTFNVTSDETFRFTLYIENMGNAPDTFEVSGPDPSFKPLGDFDSDFSMEIQPFNGTVGPGSILAVKVNLTASTWAYSGIGHLMLPMGAMSLGSGKDDMIWLDVRIFPGHENATYDLRIDPPKNLSILPGSERTFSIRITNGGKTEANLSISAKSEDNWSITGPTNLVLSLSSNQTLQYRLIVPDRILAGYNETISFNVSFNQNPLLFWTLEFNMTVSRVHGMGFICNGSSISLMKGNIRSLNLTLQNLGNGASDYVVSVSGAPGAQYVFTSDLKSIDPYSNGSITVQINSTMMDIGEYDLTFEAGDEYDKESVIVHLTVLSPYINEETQNDHPNTVVKIVLFVILALIGIMVFAFALYLFIRGRSDTESWED